MAKQIFIIIGHPDSEAFTGRVARWYAKGARTAGHKVRILDLGRTSFDPILRKGYSAPQSLERSLRKAQRDIRWANHLVVVYPNWWGSMPALLKGFFDRVFLPGFAFSYDMHKMRSKGLLTGKSGRVILLMRTTSRQYRKKFPYSGETVKNSILKFCGVNPVKMTEIGPSERIPRLTLDKIRSNMIRLGRAAI